MKMPAALEEIEEANRRQSSCIRVRAEAGVGGGMAKSSVLECLKTKYVFG